MDAYSIVRHLREHYNEQASIVATPGDQPDLFGRIRTETSGMPCYHSITQNHIFAEGITKMGKPINIYFEGIQAFSKRFTKIDVQSSNCFYKISISKRKHEMNAHVGAYSKISFFMTRRSSILGPPLITIYHSVPAHW